MPSAEHYAADCGPKVAFVGSRGRAAGVKEGEGGMLGGEWDGNGMECGGLELGD